MVVFSKTNLQAKPASPRWTLRAPPPRPSWPPCCAAALCSSTCPEASSLLSVARKAGRRKCWSLVRKFGTWIKSYALPSLARLTATCSSLRVLDRPPARSPARSLALPPSPRRSRGSLLHADPGRRRRRALWADAGTWASLLSGCCSTSTPNAGAVKSFAPLRLVRLLIFIFRAMRFTQEP